MLCEYILLYFYLEPDYKYRNNTLQKHFDEVYLDRSKKRVRLFPNAVPTIKIPKQNACMIPKPAQQQGSHQMILNRTNLSHCNCKERFTTEISDLRHHIRSQMAENQSLKQRVKQLEKENLALVR